MIITRLYGGLGNQMFQYAAGLALAQVQRTVLKLDVSWFNSLNAKADHEIYALGCLNVTAQFATSTELEWHRGIQATRSEIWFRMLAEKLGLGRFTNSLPLGGNYHGPPTFAFYPEFFKLPDGTLLDGHFQSEKFFEPVANILRYHFTFRYPPFPAVAAMAERIVQQGPSIAVHFRRGDYVKNELYSKNLGVVGFSFYERALAQIQAKHPGCTLYIFSDDIDFIEREFHPPGPHVFVKVTQPWHSFDKIRLMSLCNHFVIANSTFSWWAAWLGTHPEKMVVCPSPWFAQAEYDPRDVVPEHWIKMTRT